MGLHENPVDSHACMCACKYVCVCVCLYPYEFIRVHVSVFVDRTCVCTNINVANVWMRACFLVHSLLFVCGGVGFFLHVYACVCVCVCAVETRKQSKWKSDSSMLTAILPLHVISHLPAINLESLCLGCYDGQRRAWTRSRAGICSPLDFLLAFLPFSCKFSWSRWIIMGSSSARR